MDPRRIGETNRVWLLLGEKQNTLYLSPYSGHKSHTMNPQVIICQNYKTYKGSTWVHISFHCFGELCLNIEHCCTTYHNTKLPFTVCDHVNKLEEIQVKIAERQTPGTKQRI